MAHFRVVGGVGGKNFDGDRAVEAGVASAVDFTHAACAEGGEDFVGAETRLG